MSTTGGIGGYAGLASVPADGLIRPLLSSRSGAAAALLADGRTAVGLLDRVAIEPGATVLVEAAAGGVGSLLVQLVKRAGGFVIGAAGGEHKLEVARSLGADVAVEYGRGGWTEGGVGCGGWRSASTSCLTASAARSAAMPSNSCGPAGACARSAWRLGPFTAVSEQELADRGVTRVRGARSTPSELSGLTARALGGAAAGALRPVIGQEVPRECADDAHRAIENRATIGKTLLVP